jgi:hypothetical protein
VGDKRGRTVRFGFRRMKQFCRAFDALLEMAGEVIDANGGASMVQIGDGSRRRVLPDEMGDGNDLLNSRDDLRTEN